MSILLLLQSNFVDLLDIYKANNVVPSSSRSATNACTLHDKPACRGRFTDECKRTIGESA